MSPHWYEIIKKAVNEHAMVADLGRRCTSDKYIAMYIFISIGNICAVNRPIFPMISANDSQSILNANISNKLQKVAINEIGKAIMKTLHKAMANLLFDKRVIS